MAGLTVTSKRAHAKGHLPGLLLPVSQPPQQATATATPGLHGRASTLAGRSGSASSGVTAPLPWGLVGSRLCCARTGFCVSPVVKAHWPAKSSSLGIPMTSAGSPSWEACCGAQNLHNTGRTSLVELFSILWVAHLLGMEFDFIMIVSLLLSHCGFSFVFGCGGVFFWWVPASSCQLSNS